VMLLHIDRALRCRRVVSIEALYALHTVHAMRAILMLHHGRCRNTERVESRKARSRR
jgi:hypothetical protein